MARTSSEEPRPPDACLCTCFPWQAWPSLTGMEVGVGRELVVHLWWVHPCLGAQGLLTAERQECGQNDLPGLFWLDPTLRPSALGGWAEVRHSFMPGKRGWQLYLPSITGSWAPRCACLLGRSAGVVLGCPASLNSVRTRILQWSPPSGTETRGMSVCLPACAGPKATSCLYEVKMPREPGRRYWGSFKALK